MAGAARVGTALEDRSSDGRRVGIVRVGAVPPVAGGGGMTGGSFCAPAVTAMSDPRTSAAVFFTENYLLAAVVAGFLDRVFFWKLAVRVRVPPSLIRAASGLRFMSRTRMSDLPVLSS